MQWNLHALMTTSEGATTMHATAKNSGPVYYNDFKVKHLSGTVRICIHNDLSFSSAPIIQDQQKMITLFIIFSSLQSFREAVDKLSSKIHL